MRPHRFFLLLAALAAAGCAVGPSPRHAPAPMMPARPADVPAADRPFLDSLAQAGRMAAASRPLAADTSTALRWLDVLQDTVLESLVRTALLDNRDLQAATARVREYRAQFGAARGDLLPSLTANGGVSTNQIAIGAFPPVSYRAVRVTADVAWELDFWGRLRRQTQAAGFDLRGREDDRRAVVLSLVSDVVAAYLELRELDEDVRIAEQTLASRQTTLQLARDRFAQGLISELDVRQFEAEVAGPAGRVAQFTRLRAQKENQLRQLIGQAPGPVPRGGPLDDAVRAVSVPDSLPGALLARRPDVMRAMDDWSAASARVGVAVASRLPRIAITGSYGTQRPSTSGLFSQSGEIYSLQAGISIPLFTGGKLVNQQRAAEARAEQARARYEQTVLGAMREASDALTGLRLSRDELAAQESQARALRRGLELAQQRYQSGVSSYLEVLDVQRALFSAELALVQVERQYLGATVQLYKALGGDWEQGTAGR